MTYYVKQVALFISELYWLILHLALQHITFYEDKKTDRCRFYFL